MALEVVLRCNVAVGFVSAHISVFIEPHLTTVRAPAKSGEVGNSLHCFCPLVLEQSLKSDVIPPVPQSSQKDVSIGDPGDNTFKTPGIFLMEELAR